MPDQYRESGMPGTQQPKAKPTADELVQKLYATRIPEPTFDQDKADRLQRMGRINQAGKGISVLGDILATGLGAPVRRRQPDSTAPALYQSYQANLDKYKFEKDQNLLRDYDKDRQDLLFGIGRADRDDELEFRNRRQTAAERLAELRAKAGLSQKERELAERERHNKAAEKAAMIRANKTPAKKDPTPEKPFMVAGIDGKDIPLTQGQYRALLEEAQKTPGWAKEDFKTMMAPYQNIPEQGEKNIVQRFYNWKTQKEYAGKQKAAEEKYRQNNQQAPVKQPSGKFTLNGQTVTKPIF